MRLLLYVKLFSILFVLMLLLGCNHKKQMKYTILGLGDSITEGRGENKSYLSSLWGKLDSAGYTTEFIGPNTHMSDMGNIMNAGYSGKNAGYLDAHIDSIYSKYTADIVLLHIGHNHFAKEKPIQGIIAAQRSIIQKISSINPKVKIFVAQVIPSGKLPKYSYIPELNEQILFLVERLQKEALPVTLVNQAEGFNWEIHCLSDRVHPNARGAEVMADVWFNSIDSALKY